MATNNPVGTSVLSREVRVMGASMFARTSRPDEPAVAYAGKGKADRLITGIVTGGFVMPANLIK
jgi:hypothetical protein